MGAFGLPFFSVTGFLTLKSRCFKVLKKMLEYFDGKCYFIVDGIWKNAKEI